MPPDPSAPHPRRAGRLRRLAEELAEVGLDLPGDDRERALLVDEVDRALRPHVHERRVPSTGTVVDPATPLEAWSAGTGLDITRSPVHDVDLARLLTDGLSSWLVRRAGGPDEWLVFDRPAGSERDLAVLARVGGATLVQRHPSGSVRVVGAHGVLRWDGLDWHLEPPLGRWLGPLADAVVAPSVLDAVVDFAVHDLGANGIGALLVYRAGDGAPAGFEERLPAPPPLRIDRPAHLAPLRHALAQLDGAAVFDRDGTLVRLGVRLAPSPAAEAEVAPFRGTRHTSGRRYSYDDPSAVVVAVSEDGPVSVFRGGAVVGRSHPDG